VNEFGRSLQEHLDPLSEQVLDLSANKLGEWPTKTELPPMLEQLDLTCNPPLAGQKQGEM
jgi:hypothetical protein